MQSDTSRQYNMQLRQIGKYLSRLTSYFSPPLAQKDSQAGSRYATVVSPTTFRLQPPSMLRYAWRLCPNFAANLGCDRHYLRRWNSHSSMSVG